MAKTRLMFATDLHGSETVWRKFLNTAKIYDLDALILSGDMTSKVIVPIVKRPDGRYDARLLRQDYVLSEEELPEFSKRCRMVAYIPYVTTPEEAAKIGGDEAYREKLFERMEVEVVKYWLSLVPEKVPPKCRVIISPGNDDKFAIDEAIRQSPHVTFGEEAVVGLDGEHEVLCFGWSNPTPFNSPRECSEEELEQKLEHVVAKVKNLATAIFCIHVPPYDSGLDGAPAVDKDMRPIIRGGRVEMIPAGSKAVRRIIEKHQPLLGLHGHIHESPGFRKLGRCECLNPGSEYGEGIFKGYLVELDGNKVKKLQRIEG